MKRLALALVALAASAASASTGAPDQVFSAAGEAWKARQYRQAADLYGQLASDGYATPEVFFNRGNALYKAGEAAQAILSYRRAWMLSPRDSDIQANLAFAMREAGAAGPDLSPLEKAFTRLSASEWAVIGTICFWLAAACMAAHLLRRGRNPALRRAALLLLAPVALSLSAASTWRQFEVRPERVLLRQANALYGPVEGETPHIALNAGSIVRTLGKDRAWVHIESGGKQGYLKAADAEAVYPWQPQAE